MQAGDRRGSQCSLADKVGIVACETQALDCRSHVTSDVMSWASTEDLLQLLSGHLGKWTSSSIVPGFNQRAPTIDLPEDDHRPAQPAGHPGFGP